MRIALLGLGKGGLYKQVVFICRWSLGQVQLYIPSECFFSHDNAYLEILKIGNPLAHKSVYIRSFVWDRISQIDV